jgi:hypothetical protein
MVCLQFGAVPLKFQSLSFTKERGKSENCAEKVEESKVVWDRGVIPTLSDRVIRGDFAVLYTDVTMVVYMC